MSDFSDAVVARLASLEALIVGTMRLLFAMAGNDPDQSKQKAHLAVLKQEFEEGMTHLPQPIQDEAKAHMSDLLDRVILTTNQLREDRRPN